MGGRPPKLPGGRMYQAWSWATASPPASARGATESAVSTTASTAIIAFRPECPPCPRGGCIDVPPSPPWPLHGRIVIVPRRARSSQDWCKKQVLCERADGTDRSMSRPGSPPRALHAIRIAIALALLVGVVAVQAVAGPAGPAGAAPNNYVTMPDGVSHRDQRAAARRLPGRAGATRRCSRCRATTAARPTAARSSTTSVSASVPVLPSDDSRQLSRSFNEQYVTVHASVRGTGCSGGEFDLFSRKSAEDGKYIIDQWIPEAAVVERRRRAHRPLLRRHHRLHDRGDPARSTCGWRRCRASSTTCTAASPTPAA